MKKDVKRLQGDIDKLNEWQLEYHMLDDLITDEAIWNFASNCVKLK